MLPLSDNNPTLTTPHLTWALIAICVVVYLWQISVGPTPQSQQQLVYMYGFIPALTFGGYTATLAHTTDWNLNIGWPALFSSMFMHGSWMHLGGNILFLWIFGDNLEERLGKIRFLAFYTVCGIAAATTQALLDPTSFIPMIGASGAISGILGGYWLLYPRQQITVMMPYHGLTQMPALIVLGLWFAGQLAQSMAVSPGSGGVAFGAHIGGFIAGVILIKLFTIGKNAPHHHPPFANLPPQPHNNLPQLWQAPPRSRKPINLWKK